MGKKARMRRYPQKFGRKFASHPYARAIANNEEYNKQLDILKYSNNLSTPELKTQLMNTLLDVHKSGKDQFDAKERKNDLKTKMRGQVTQKEFFTKVPQELWANPDKPEPDVAIGINEILTRKGKFDEQVPFQGQFYFYAYDPVLKRYLQFKNAEELVGELKDMIEREPRTPNEINRY